MIKGISFFFVVVTPACFSCSMLILTPLFLLKIPQTKQSEKVKIPPSLWLRVRSQKVQKLLLYFCCVLTSNC